MRDVIQDIRYGLRALLGMPGAAGVAVFALALGIGANSAVFSVINAVLIRPLPYRDPASLVVVWENKLSKNMRQQPVSAADYRDLREQNQVFERIGAFEPQSAVLTGSGLPERVEAAEVSPGIFEILGMSPALGRSFAYDEDQPAKNSVAILSDGLWQRRFGGDRRVLGSSVRVDDRNYTVVGIAPPGFRLLDNPAELWVPYTPNAEQLRRRGLRTLTMFARLKPGVTRTQAEIQMRAVARRLAEDHPDSNAGYSVDVIPLSEQMTGDVRPTLWTLMGSVTLILLIACANVANLLLARAGNREKEMAVRAALGAKPARIVRQLLTESVLLASIGGALGLALAYAATPALVRLAPANVLRARDITMDWRVVAFTLCASMATGVLFGLAPAVSAARTDLNSTLKSTTRGGSGHRARSSLRNALVISEVSCCLVLLILAGLLMRSFSRLGEVHPGFRADHVLTMQISLPPARYSGLRAEMFYKQLLDRVSVLPGAQSAGLCRFLPLSGNDATANFLIEGQPALTSADQPRAKFRAAGGAYFTALRIPLLHGRLFDASDDERTPKVVIINQAAARQYWPNEDPVGKRILSGFEKDQWSTIIGVVGNVKHAGLDAETQPETYYHFLQIPPEAVPLAEGTMALVIRTSTAPAAMISTVRDAVRSLDPEQPVYDVRTMEEVRDGSVAQPRFRTVLLGVFAGLAVLLAAIGLYGVMAYSVAQRRNELGVRMALGAEPGYILRLVLGNGLVLAAIGLAIGLAAAVACARMISGFLFGVQATDIVTFGLCSLFVLSVAAMASVIPAMRATRVDPVSALRME